MKKRVVVTGLGAVTPIGNNVGDFWNNVKKVFVALIILLFLMEKFKGKIFAEIKNLKLEDHFSKNKF